MISSFQTFTFYFSLSQLAGLEPVIPLWIGVNSGHLCQVPDIEGKTLCASWLGMMLPAGIFLDIPYQDLQVSILSLLRTFLFVLITNECWVTSNNFCINIIWRSNRTLLKLLCLLLLIYLFRLFVVYIVHFLASYISFFQIFFSFLSPLSMGL